MNNYLTAGVIGVVTITFLFAFIANGYGQWVTTHSYVPPDSLVNIIKLVFSAAVGSVVIGVVKTKKNDDSAK